MKDTLLTKILNHRVQIIAIVLFVTSVFLFNLCKESYRESKLQNYRETFAIYIQQAKGIGQSRGQYYFFDIKGRRTEALIDYNSQKKGDTIWIKYSIYDPTVAELVDKNYLKHMKNQIKSNGSDKKILANPELREDDELVKFVKENFPKNYDQESKDSMVVYERKTGIIPPSSK